MRRLFLLLVSVLILLATVPASAQAGVRMSSALVQLWPEYDRPGMLVIYTLELADDVPLPAEVAIRIPADVGEPTAVAVAEAGGLVTRGYERTVDGDWATITLQADFPIIQLEYYDFSLSQSDNPRSYTYVWPGDFAVDELVVRVQQPVNASSLTTTPELEGPTQGSDNLNYYSANLGSVAAGEEISLAVSYTKGDTALTADTLFSQPGSSQSPVLPTPDSSGGLPVWAWVVVGVGVALIFLGAIYFMRLDSTSGQTSKYRKKKSRSASRGSRSSGRQVFCHNCGHLAGRGDKFCRECGTKLRL